MKINWTYQPEIVSTSLHTVGNQYGYPIFEFPIFIDFISGLEIPEETKQSFQTQSLYRYILVTVQKYNATRNYLIDLFIRQKYSIADMEAIHNNYLLSLSGNYDEQAVAEFNEMQQWRARSKQEADRVLQMINEYQEESV